VIVRCAVRIMVGFSCEWNFRETGTRLRGHSIVDRRYGLINEW
jgi:hypothetical protein